MVQLIVGDKGKGKTKELLDKANSEIQSIDGNIVYLDKSSKHMFELNNKIRLIDTSAYPLRNSDEFVGFLCGVISQDHDLQKIYLDSFLKIAKLESMNINDTIKQLDNISEQFGIDFVISLSMDKNELSEDLQEKIIVSL